MDPAFLEWNNLNNEKQTAERFISDSEMSFVWYRPMKFHAFVH